MRIPWLTIGAALAFLALGTGASAQVSVSYDHKVCLTGQDCTVDIWVNSASPIGNLVVLLHYDSTKLTVIGLQNGGYMSTGGGGQLTYCNSAASCSTACAGQPTCGYILYHGLDPTDSTVGSGTLMRVTLRVTASTQLLWHVCSCLCNASFCPMYPFATPYNGGPPNYGFSFSGALIEASGTPPVDSDGDCILNYIEADRGTDPLDTDSDDDGLTDGTCPAGAAWPPSAAAARLRSPTDGEDLNNDSHQSSGETDPADADSDDDGLFDGTERGLAAPQTPGTNLGAGNFRADADPLTTTDPLDADSDDDAVPDGVEDLNRNGAFEADKGESNPTDPGSMPTFPPLKAAARVLLLGDGEAETQVETALEAAGHPTTLVPLYYEWDGVDPDADDFDMIVMLDGYDYGYELLDEASARLARFVAQGCGLLLTEWTAYDVCHEYKTGTVADLMPTTSAPDCDYVGDLPWTMTFAHPLTSGVATNWADEVTSGIVRAAPGAIVVAHVGEHPGLTYDTRHGGKVVHLNHDMTYSKSEIHPNALQLLVNSVGFASCDKVFTDGFETGDLLDWTSHVP